jgi:exodeoxyribonuclease VII large subunit
MLASPSPPDKLPNVDEPQFSFSFNPEASPVVPERRIYGVGELVSSVRGRLEQSFPDVWVQGEISNHRPAESGHLYLTLKDGDAQLRVVMFRNQARLLRFRPANGMAVLVRGRVTLYEARGELQMMAEFMEPMGAGALQVAFEQLKARLAAEGLFDPARKKTLPALPRRIGVITSPRGAVIQDILNVVRRRHQSLGVLLYPALVQGEGAAEELAAGVWYFNQQATGSAHAVDVILLARGGGSLEDLAAFNDEGLARAVVASKLPVISAVGHETDFTICDFVADLRAPTPSAAAEIVVRSHHEIEEEVAGLASRLRRAMQYKLLYERQQLTALARHRVFARMEDAIARRQQRVDELRYRLESLVRTRLGQSERRLELALAHLHRRELGQQLQLQHGRLAAHTVELATAMRSTLLWRRTRLEQAAGKLEALSPLAILGRGYSLIFDARGRLVKDTAQLATGDLLRAQLATGEVAARVESLTPPSHPQENKARPKKARKEK